MQETRSFSIPQILQRPDVLIRDFQEVYGLELEQVLSVRSWAWFITRVSGLLDSDTRLRRSFT